jgi:hypothetical protein
MSSTITIPAQLVRHARSATTVELGEAAGEIREQSQRKQPELREPLARFDTLRAALDTLPADPGTAEVDKAHLSAMVEALRAHVRALTELKVDEAREGHADEVARYGAELDEIESGLDELLAAQGGDV